ARHSSQLFVEGPLSVARVERQLMARTESVDRPAQVDPQSCHSFRKRSRRLRAQQRSSEWPLSSQHGSHVLHIPCAPQCPQLTAFFTSAPIFASSAAVSSFSAKAVGHMWPSSRFALSLKPSVAYLVLNFCALWKKQTTLPSLAYAGIPYQVFGERAGALALMIAWSRSPIARSGCGSVAIFASTALSPSAWSARRPRRPSAFSSWRRSFI